MFVHSAVGIFFLVTFIDLQGKEERKMVVPLGGKVNERRAPPIPGRIITGSP